MRREQICDEQRKKWKPRHGKSCHLSSDRSMAIGNAVLTVSAQCAGAGDYEQVKYYAKKLHIIIYGLMIVCCLGVIAVLPAASKS